MESIHNFFHRKAVMHTFFWIIMMMIVFASENFEYGNKIQWHMLFHFALAFIIFALVSYYNVYYLIPKYFNKKEYTHYGLMLVLGMVVGASLVLLFKELTQLIGFMMPEPWNHSKNESSVAYFFHILYGELMFLLATTFFYILEELIRLQGVTIKIKEVESQKMRSELQALKAQINPHFLFNTLNNIYSHSLDNSPQTPEMILKLSALMSYILYDCHEERVPVTNELEFINNYLQLEKLRFEDTLDVNLQINQTHTNRTIAPLLLIPFIENAFKHGSCSCTSNTKKFVTVSIDIQDSAIHFSCQNSIDHSTTTKIAVKESGIGIENVKKRLELLYPNQYNLQIEVKENIFSVQLTITEHGN